MKQRRIWTIELAECGGDEENAGLPSTSLETLENGSTTYRACETRGDRVFQKTPGSRHISGTEDENQGSWVTWGCWTESEFGWWTSRLSPQLARLHTGENASPDKGMPLQITYSRGGSTSGEPNPPFSRKRSVDIGNWESPTETSPGTELLYFYIINKAQCCFMSCLRKFSLGGSYAVEVLIYYHFCIYNFIIY